MEINIVDVISWPHFASSFSLSETGNMQHSGVLHSNRQQIWIQSITHTKCGIYISYCMFKCAYILKLNMSFPQQTATPWLSPSKLSHIASSESKKKKLLQQCSCELTVILNFGNCKGGREMCLVQLLLVTGCSLSGSRHGCHCGSVLCCCVCVRKAFSSESCDSEDVWGALRCPHSRNTATATMRPANYASSMQMSHRARETETEKESKRESALKQRHNRVCEGSMCAPLSLRLLFNCHVYPVTTSHVISTQCSVICVVTPLYGTMGSLLLAWAGKIDIFYVGNPDTLHGVVFPVLSNSHGAN